MGMNLRVNYPFIYKLRINKNLKAMKRENSLHPQFYAPDLRINELKIFENEKMHSQLYVRPLGMNEWMNKHACVHVPINQTFKKILLH